MSRPVINLATDGQGTRYAFFACPGCGDNHGPVVEKKPGVPGPVWGWNGSETSPTFTPSLLVRGTRPITDEEHARLMRGEKIEPEPRVCHSFITDGRIRFLDDCTHALKGHTVPLEPWE